MTPVETIKVMCCCMAIMGFVMNILVRQNDKLREENKRLREEKE